MAGWLPSVPRVRYNYFRKKLLRYFLLTVTNLCFFNRSFEHFFMNWCNIIIVIDGQVRLVCLVGLVRLQTISFCLLLRQLID
jgi:hypothetical protein